MKKVLLTTSALVAFAGYAAADVSFGGEVTVGYNDVEENGFYLEGELNITGTAEFDNGVAVEVTYGIDLMGDGSGYVQGDAFPTVTVTTQWATLTVGDVEYAAVDMFNELDGMAFGNYSDEEAWREVNGEIVARVDVTFGGFTIGISADTNAVNTGFNHASDALSIGVSGEFGAFRFTAAYDQSGLYDGDSDDNTQMDPFAATFYGVSVGTTFGGFDIDVAYMAEDLFIDTNSTAVAVATTIGDVALSGYYAMNSHADDAYGVAAAYTTGALTVGAYWDGDNGDWLGGAGDGVSDSNFGIDIGYAINDNISVAAGYDQADGAYIYGLMAVGAATVGAGWAEYTEAGDEEIREGVSVWMTMPF